MTKEKKYLPLVWADGFKEWKDREDIPSPLEMRILVEERYGLDEKMEYIHKYNDFLSTLGHNIVSPYGNFFPDMEKGFSQEKFNEDIRDLDCISMINLWSENKQVFKLDKDFSEELVDTENLKMVKDLYDHLPFSVFYVDFSDNIELCKQLQGKGFFVMTEKVEEKNTYNIHICKVSEDLFYNDLLIVRNEDCFLPIETATSMKTKVYHEKNGVSTVNINRQLYQKLVLQTLTYLSSSEQDIRENETTKRTYKKPDPNNIKNKFSEVRIQDVGVRFGTAFRKWTAVKNQPKNSEVNHTGIKQRPHFRRAHWHTYLYGKGRLERKVVWQHECAINMDLKKDAGVVIHKTKRPVERDV